jgi:hypothetical protein
MQEAMTPVPPIHQDRSGALVAFGVLELLLALGCVAMACLTLLAILAQPAASFATVGVRGAGTISPAYPPPPAASVAMAAFFYLGIAVVFGWLGVGAILARRWARTLNLALGWISPSSRWRSSPPSPRQPASSPPSIPSSRSSAAS